LGESVGSKTVNEALERGHEAVQSTLQDAQRAASRVTSQAVSKWRQLCWERPMRVILGAAIAGFLVGAALRTWRSRYE
jgi:ElaB/YqjD/DUF883 family membrane-anchored ribosome-binding protein